MMYYFLVAVRRHTDRVSAEILPGGNPTNMRLGGLPEVFVRDLARAIGEDGQRDFLVDIIAKSEDMALTKVHSLAHRARNLAKTTKK
jgi:hypothetical protein